MRTRARDLFAAFGRERRALVCTDWVIAEVGNGLARSSQRSRVTEWIRLLLDSPVVTVVFIDRVLLTASLGRYDQWRDKTCGLVDCASFEVMRNQGILQAFTTDRHFEQAGFVAMLR